MSANCTGRVNGELTEWFNVTVGVIQGYNLSPYLFNLLLETMMTEALKTVEGGMIVIGWPINNLHLADDISLISKSSRLQDLTSNRKDCSKRFSFKIYVQKTKL